MPSRKFFLRTKTLKVRGLADCGQPKILFEVLEALGCFFPDAIG